MTQRAVGAASRPRRLRLDLGAGVPEASATEPGVDDAARTVMARVARTFDLAARFLPTRVRRDVRLLYLVMRTLDDLVDGGDPRAPHELALVEAWAAGAAPEGCLAPILEELAGRYPLLPRDAVADFCTGMRADVAGPAHATDGDLDRYCYQVAGTVGRLMAALLGVRPGRAAEADVAARRLGAAMQRTNILRDLTADAEAGRVYLPDEAFLEIGLTPEALRDGAARTILADLPRQPVEVRRALLAREIARADADYEAGLAGIAALALGRRSIAAAAHLYRGILRGIERDGYGASGRRVVVSGGRKAVLLVRAAVGA